MKSISAWNTKELAAQIVFPRLTTDLYFEDRNYKDEIINLVKLGVGGFCVFTGNTQKVKQMIEELQSFADIPLLFSADFENGLAMRLEDGTSFPHAMALGIANDLQATEKVAKAIAKETKDIGILWNLAPVCDTNNNPRNPIINIRAFSNEFSKVADFSKAYIVGTASEKILTCAKHFPGHGDTEIDSHINLPILNKSHNDLINNEFIPFISAINTGVSSVMLGHLMVKDIDEHLPASLSEKFVSILRNDLNFNGLIVTDALDMNALTLNYQANEIVENVIKSGVDVALLPTNPNDFIEQASMIIESDNTLINKVVESVGRIIKAKRSVGLIPQFAKTNLKEALFTEHLDFALKVAYKGVVVESNTGDLPIDYQKPYASFSFIQTDDDLRSASRFYTMLAQASENNCDYAFVDTNISDEEIENFKASLEDAEFYVFAVFAKGRAFTGSIELSEKVYEIIDRLSQGKKVYLLIFGNPYFSKQIPYKNVIYTFSDSFASLAAAVMKLTGRELIDN